MFQGEVLVKLFEQYSPLHAGVTEAKDEPVTDTTLLEAAAVITCLSTFGAAGLYVDLVRASIVDADEGCDILVNVLAFLLVATEEILAFEQGVVAETKVTADFIDDAINVLIRCDVQSPVCHSTVLFGWRAERSRPWRAVGVRTSSITRVRAT